MEDKAAGHHVVLHLRNEQAHILLWSSRATEGTVGFLWTHLWLIVTDSLDIFTMFLLMFQVELFCFQQVKLPQHNKVNYWQQRLHLYMKNKCLYQVKPLEKVSWVRIMLTGAKRVLNDFLRGWISGLFDVQYVVECLNSREWTLLVQRDINWIFIWYIITIWLYS